ncbi:toll/interleukin-1 receptor domain-containing protein [Flavobacterium sp. NG2]|uniref:toll/interleukin-1 receptor domain-containing protein n=1 Tax=Flavobacterium sp. NG2 TaxID=3097547 RepID=UPI002A83EB2B|nr:toll/interleukin-1 receptor domain-containing protein [Flavobacterium sp. NG2]WPR71570.1 toll/interleukin-1 receptor domain-containing protein [Flavobacterium sp. NG2]
MSVISKSTLLENRNKTRTFSKSITDSLSEFKKETSAGKTTIFLSHKHDELAELDSAVSFLKRFGVNIYVDWLDTGMPKNTSGKTAKRIKDKIDECDKFILLATESAIASKWCNWELGYGDAKRYDRNIAIFPIRNDGDSFSGSEYLQIYPRIESIQSNTISRKIGGYFDGGYYVISPTDEDGYSYYTKLEEWLSRR